MSCPVGEGADPNFKNKSKLLLCKARPPKINHSLNKQNDLEETLLYLHGIFLIVCIRD
jgi:hypothetical protein